MKKYLAIPALSLMFGSAQAAVPTDVTTALTTAAADSVTVAGLALAIIVGIAAFRYMRRAI